ncbi:NAD-dependent epimerase/dehydratase family protein [Longispora albida]|uniref:NAD-dependent epimerase/dehydratase family protein n=1 Tax=Longispora albida TaxID=203523 RepID=UPI0003685D3A|nr:NAD-dependent epimerase/dehydratase family protein [Longispora albida]
MKVLVTGGLGFVGHAVVRELAARGDTVTVLTRRQATGPGLVTGDVRDRARLAEIMLAGQFEGIVHLAALGQVREPAAGPLVTFDVNLAGTLNLLMALPEAPVPFVFASTSIVYGPARTGALSEDLDPHPGNPYAESKLAAERLIGAYAATGRIAAVSLRCFNVAGAVDGVPDRDPARIIPNAIRAATGELPHVTLNGDGRAVRDFVHVADVARAFAAGLDAAVPGEHLVCNVGSGHGTSMAEVVAAVQRVSGVDFPVVHAPPKPEPQSLTADISRAGNLLGWHPASSTLAQIVEDAWHAARSPGTATAPGLPHPGGAGSDPPRTAW